MDWNRTHEDTTGNLIRVLFFCFEDWMDSAIKIWNSNLKNNMKILKLQVRLDFQALCNLMKMY